MVFGLFKKKPVPVPGTDPRIVGLLGLFEGLSDEFTPLYEDFERYNPAELRFVTMSAISVYIQSYGNLPGAEMQAVVGTFTEQAIATLLFNMPNASYDLVHNAFVDRFGEYADLIVDVTNASTDTELQRSTMALITAMDKNIRVEREAVDAIIQALKLVLPLTNCAADVRDVLA